MMMRKFMVLGIPAALVAGLFLGRDGSRPAGLVPSWSAVTARLYLGGLQAPVAIVHSSDRTGRLFVVEQPGRIRIVKNGALLDRPFLAIEDRILYGGERGLLGAAFPPGYAAKGYFFVNYTRQPDGATVVSKFSVLADPDLALPETEETILVVPQPFANHNGGQLAFGPMDGYLYIGLGDGGSGGDPFNNAQNAGSLLGKILRIDTETGAGPYQVPGSNPFVGVPGAAPEVWALGLRNPWRFSFDRETGDLYIGDVGQGLWEEIDVLPAAHPGGANFGWRITEGFACFNPPSGCVRPEAYVPPIAVYGHGSDCSVTGGFVYRGELHPDLAGIYFYGDFCGGTIRGLRRTGTAWESATLLDMPIFISAFGEDEKGNLFVADYASGALYLLAGNELAGGRVPKS